LNSGHAWWRDAVRTGLRWVIDNRLVLAVGLAAAVPVILSTVGALVDGWTPVFDDAIAATRSFDVFSAHSPLVGAYTDASLPRIGPVFSPGPLLYWLLAVQARFLGDWALPVTMGLVNTASIMGVVALARRRGGRVLMFATAVALVVMCRSLPQGQFHEIDNSRAGVVVFTLLLFLAWSVACGEYRLLPLTVLVASFVAQVHFSLGLPGLAVFLVALAGLAWSRSASRGAGTIAPEHRRRWLLGALVVALVCWSAPLLDQQFNSPGNLTRIVQTATAHQATDGVTMGAHALVRAIGIWPKWLRPYTAVDPARDQARELVVTPNALAIASSVLILGALAIVALVGIRRRRPNVATGAALALVLNGAVVVAVASTPSRLNPALYYGLRWTSPAGMFTWLVLGWCLAEVLRPTSWRAVNALRTLAVRRSASTALIGLTITAMLGFAVATGPQSDDDILPWAYRPARTVEALVGARLPRERAVLVRASSPIGGFPFQTAIIYRLRQLGYRVVAPNDVFSNLAQRLGAYYSPGGTADRRYDDVLLVDVTSALVPSGGHVLVRVPLRGAPRDPDVKNEPPPTAVTVSVTPVR
jgi:hypothetical protein